MKKRFFVLVCLLPVISCNATIVPVDADGFNNGDNISNTFAGVALSSVGGYAGLDGFVYAWADGLASTGTNVFANNLSFQRQWSADLAAGFALRADFDYLTNYVAIDIIGDDSGDFGVLNAYNSSGTLVDSVLSPQLGYGQVYQAVISRPSFEIAYVIAGGSESSQDAVHLDNLVANVVPEPATLLLLGLGGLAICGRGRSKK